MFRRIFQRRSASMNSYNDVNNGKDYGSLLGDQSNYNRLNQETQDVIDCWPTSPKFTAFIHHQSQQPRRQDDSISAASLISALSSGRSAPKNKFTEAAFKQLYSEDNSNVERYLRHSETEVIPARRKSFNSRRKYLSSDHILLDSNLPPRNIRRKLAKANLKNLKETSQVDTASKSFNKIFCSAWLNQRTVLFGTKCNRLFLLDSKAMTMTEQRLPCRTPFGLKDNLPNHVQSEDHSESEDTVSVQINPNEPESSPDLSEEGRRQAAQSCGMHDISVCPETLSTDRFRPIATGGKRANDITVFDGSKGGLDPTYILKGHSDWAFSFGWISPDLLVSGGKDEQILIWRVPEPDRDDHFEELPSDAAQFTPHTMNRIRINSKEPIRMIEEPVTQLKFPVESSTVYRSQGSRTVRALQCHPQRRSSIVTLTTDGSLQLWDSRKSELVWQHSLMHTKESVTLAINPELGTIGVGSQQHIQFIDPRCPQHSSFNCKSKDKGWGVRSLQWCCDNSVCSIGGGFGRLSFFDLRKQDYINLNHSPKNIQHLNLDGATDYIQVKKQWIREDEVFTNVFRTHGLATPKAIYTHAFNPQSNQIFVGGGPTPFGLYGSLASILS